MAIRPDDLIGERLEGVRISWYEHQGSRVEFPVHIWLLLESLGSVRLHTAGDGSLDLRVDIPHADYAMDSGGRVVVEAGGPDSAIGRFVGERVRAVHELRDLAHDEAVGFVLDFAAGSVGIANVADDFVVLQWPSEAWDRVAIGLGER